MDEEWIDTSEVLTDSELDYYSSYEVEKYSYGVEHIKFTRTCAPSVHAKAGFLSFGLLLPFTVAIDVAKRAYFGKGEKFVFAETGETLGTTRNEAAEKANRLGLEMLRKGKLQMAEDYCNAAYYLCENDSWNESRYLENRNRAKAKRQEEEERELFRKAQTLWDDGFTAEAENDCTAASSMFQECHELFNKLASINSANELYQNWSQISALKLEGDRLFNEAVTLQEEGRKLRVKQKYRKALEKYEKAKRKYKKALDKSHDERFEACIKIVDECLEEIQIEISSIELGEQMENIEINSETEIGNSRNRSSTTDTVNAVLSKSWKN